MRALDRIAHLPPLRLTPREFMALLEYSSSLPTGTVPGKRWRRHDGAHDPTCEDPVWMIGEYGAISEDGKKIGLNWYRPIITVRADTTAPEAT